jgi:hypothetical protein
MNAKRTVTLVLWVLALLVAWSGWDKELAARRLAASIDAGKARTATLRKDLAGIEERRTLAVRTGPSRQASVTPIGVRQAIVPGKDAASEARSLQLENDLLDVRRKALALNHGRIFKKLGLTPEQISKFEDIWMEHESSLSDIQATAEGLPKGDSSIATLTRQANEQFKAAELALLGQAGYDQLAQSEIPGPENELTQMIGLKLAFTESPLQPEQYDQLLQTLRSSGSQPSGAAPGAPMIKVTDINWTSVQAQAAGFLSPSQLETLSGVAAVMGRSAASASAMKELQNLLGMWAKPAGSAPGP